jgi:hypothetical protein
LLYPSLYSVYALVTSGAFAPFNEYDAWFPSACNLDCLVAPGLVGGVLPLPVLNGVPVFVYKSNSPMIFVFDYKYYIL